MADPTVAQYRALWVDTFNTPLNNRSDVAAVVATATAAHANAIFAQVRRRGDAWYRRLASRSTAPRWRSRRRAATRRSRRVGPA
jgi:uncharacterized lipoprotein YddW (UPF0748 family)